MWNVFTAGLIETDVFRVSTWLISSALQKLSMLHKSELFAVAQLLLSLVGVLVLAKVVEPVWGSKGFLLFVAIVNFWTGFCTFVLLYLLYTVDRTGDLL